MGVLGYQDNIRYDRDSLLWAKMRNLGQNFRKRWAWVWVVDQKHI